MKKVITEADVEENVLAILKNLGYEIIRGEDEDYIPGGPMAIRRDYKEVILEDRLRDSLRRINPSVPDGAIEHAIRQIRGGAGQKLIADNEDFHKMLVNGLDVPIKTKDGERSRKVWLFEFDQKKMDSNDFVAVNQFTVIEGSAERRPDVVLFVNGIPLLVFELKNLADEKADIKTAYNQFQTYMDDIPSLFRFNEILVVSDGMEARAGTISSEWERFMQWKTIDGEMPKNALTEIEVLLRGMCERHRFLDIVSNFVVFENDRIVTKKLAAYHQYWAANKAVESTIKARKSGRKAGIVWHTQGSGKSLTMIFYAGKLVRELDNPTLVVLTDRNDLDDQLFGTFGRCRDILRQKPGQAERRKDLKKLLNVSSGGIVFTTIQKFFPDEDRERHPILSERDNIVVIADEAHRTQYGFSARIISRMDKTLLTYGHAKYLRDALPNASFIGFTGTPIEKADKSTRAVFGKYVDTYDIRQAVNDGATVKIYYEPRLARLELKPEERPKIDREFEQITEDEEAVRQEQLKTEWSRVEKIAGSPTRIRKIAYDIVRHFEERTSVVEGKAMIVCMSRRICIALHDEIVRIKPEWYSEDHEKGALKVVMTGSASDPRKWQEHIRNKKKRKQIGDSFKVPEEDPRVLIVRDMFLTGFDAPSLHTMYLDKPISGHTLMQAIARVNRVYPGKKGGLVVDYMGVGAELKNAMADYTAGGGKGRATFDQDEAVSLMLVKYEIVRDMFHGFNYRKFFEMKQNEKISFMPNAIEHILKEKGRKERFLKETASLIGAFSLSVPHSKAIRIRNEVGLFQAIRSAIVKTTGTKTDKHEQLDAAIKQIISKAVISDRVIDVFEAAGMQKPEVSILSEDFLNEVKGMPQKNLAFEALKKLLNDEIRLFSKKNIVQGRSFMELLEKAIRRYTNRNVDAVQVIEELIDIARKVRDEKNRGKRQNMTDDELAFYDALGVNDSAVKVLGDKTLRKIALELTDTIRKSVTIDWTQREAVQADLRLKVKKILKKYGYPPDKQKNAINTVLIQAGVIAKDWAEK